MRKCVPAEVDARDWHVAAAALVLRQYAQADNANDHVYILTNNIKHLAEQAMHRLCIGVVTPGAFLDALAQAAPERVGLALEKSVAALRQPPYTRAQLLYALHLHGAHLTVRHFAQQWGIQYDILR